MNNKTVTLTAIERSYLIIELQKTVDELCKKAHKEAEDAGNAAAYYILSDARFLAELLNKIKGADDEL